MNTILASLCLNILIRLGGEAATGATVSIGRPQDRSDRLVTIVSQPQQAMTAEWSADGGKAWHPATIYVGTTIDDWRTCDAAVWNLATVEGQIPAGGRSCLWNYFFDLAMPVDHATLRLRDSGSDEILAERTVDLRGGRDVLVADHRSLVRLAGGTLPASWSFKRGTKKKPTVDSVWCSARDPSGPPLVIKPSLKGWYRIYVGMEPYATFQFSLSKEGILYPVPEYLGEGEKTRSRLMQEFHIKSADLTGQDLRFAVGGARHWLDASLRYVRFVPMANEDVARLRQARELAQAKGRPFAGYVEPCTPAYYEPETLTLRDHLRNEMRLNRARGCTDVYVHVIRIGCRAWYHSDVVERFMPVRQEVGSELGWLKYADWMRQGDPLAAAIEEARAVGLKVFPDAGMNATYLGSSQHYRLLTDRFPREHPECIVGGSYLDYRKPLVRDYVVSVVAELMSKYDGDGIHLDFARWGHNRAYDEASLVDVLRRIHETRRAAERKWGHGVEIAVRIPSYLYDHRPSDAFSGDYPEFTAALTRWAKECWIDRVMACSMGYADHVARLSLGRYKAAIAGANVKLWGDLYGGGAFEGTPRSVWLNIARKWVSEGLDGGLFFYTTDRPMEFDQINWQLRLIDFPQVAVEPGDR